MYIDKRFSFGNNGILLKYACSCNIQLFHLKLAHMAVKDQFIIYFMLDYLSTIEAPEGGIFNFFSKF